jgi:hypothetical protein
LMCWWKTALYDTCLLITLDKLVLERAALEEHFPSSILALEGSLFADQLREETAQRMRSRVTICGLPTPNELSAIFASAVFRGPLPMSIRWSTQRRFTAGLRS